MSLETATYIDQLVPTNPQQTDPVAQGDDHLRMIKSVLQQSLPLCDGPLNISPDLVQIGDSTTATHNFTMTAAAADGTMKLARGDQGATTQDIMTVDAAGKVLFPSGSEMLGVGQTWQNVIGSRVAGTTYTNDTGKPIQLYITASPSSITAVFDVSVGGEVMRNTANNLYQQLMTTSVIVPTGAQYVVAVVGAVVAAWKELR